MPAQEFAHPVCREARRCTGETGQIGHKLSFPSGCCQYGFPVAYLAETTKTIYPARQT